MPSDSLISFDILAVAVVYLTTVSTFGSMNYDPDICWLYSIPILFGLMVLTSVVNNISPFKRFLKWKLTPLKCFLDKKFPKLYEFLRKKTDVFKFCNEFYSPEKFETNHYVGSEKCAKFLNSQKISMVWQSPSEPVYIDELWENSDFKIKKVTIGSDFYNGRFDLYDLVERIRNDEFLLVNLNYMNYMYQMNKESTDSFKKDLIWMCYGEYDTQMGQKNKYNSLAMYENGFTYAHRFFFFDEVYLFEGHKEGNKVTIDIHKRGSGKKEKIYYFTKEYTVSFDNLMSNLSTFVKNLRSSLVIKEGVFYTHCPEMDEIFEILTKESLCHFDTKKLNDSGFTNTGCDEDKMKIRFSSPVYNLLSGFFGGNKKVLEDCLKLLLSYDSEMDEETIGEFLLRSRYLGEIKKYKNSMIKRIFSDLNHIFKENRFRKINICSKMKPSFSLTSIKNKVLEIEVINETNFESILDKETDPDILLDNLVKKTKELVITFGAINCVLPTLSTFEDEKQLALLKNEIWDLNKAIIIEEEKKEKEKEKGKEKVEEEKEEESDFVKILRKHIKKVENFNEALGKPDVSKRKIKDLELKKGRVLIEFGFQMESVKGIIGSEVKVTDLAQMDELLSLYIEKMKERKNKKEEEGPTLEKNIKKRDLLVLKTKEISCNINEKTKSFKEVRKIAKKSESMKLSFIKSIRRNDTKNFTKCKLGGPVLDKVILNPKRSLDGIFQETNQLELDKSQFIGLTPKEEKKKRAKMAGKMKKSLRQKSTKVISFGENKFLNSICKVKNKVRLFKSCISLVEDKEMVSVNKKLDKLEKKTIKEEFFCVKKSLKDITNYIKGKNKEVIDYSNFKDSNKKALPIGNCQISFDHEGRMNRNKFPSENRKGIYRKIKVRRRCEVDEGDNLDFNDIKGSTNIESFVRGNLPGNEAIRLRVEEILRTDFSAEINELIPKMKSGEFLGVS